MSGTCTPPSTGPFAGVTSAALQQMLTEAQTALHALVTGTKPQVVIYNNGAGQKSVTYTKTNMDDLRTHINELQRALGITPRRRALAIGFA